MASSSSSIARPKLYDAFISHRGPDVKETLAKQLYDLLKARQCRAFLDREEIKGGDSIPLAIRNGICSSLVQVAIFSKGYAESMWCLDELVLMLEQPDALFIPVFYDVEPWELRHIENEKSRYAAAFSDYRSKGRYLDKLDGWRKALKSAADISGYQLSQYQDNLGEEIVSRVVQVVQERILLDVAKYPVGLAELVQDFESCCSETRRHKKPRTMDNVRIEGIYGLGGSGKTTLAKELFNRKRSGYHASCFLSDVRESHARGELHYLQSQLLKDLFSLEDPKISSVHHGIGKLKDHLGRARHLNFLVVLDDIDHQDQLDDLLPEGMLSSSSLVIITTRDQSVLTGADIRYKMKGLNWDHAKDLFCSHAFRRRDPPIDYEKLVESFLEFCGGLPLSLKVLGAHLKGRDEYYWGLQLEKVKKIQPKDIMQRLKISFDGLDVEEKQIFIDIACLFNKKHIIDLKSKTILIWNACGWSAEHAVQTLQDKCLIEYDLNEFEMHDHLRDLGRQMADDLGPPRLWRPHILGYMEAKGFKQILTETKGRCFHCFTDSAPTDSSLKSRFTFFLGNSNDSAETDLLWLQIDYLKEIPSWIPLRKLQYLSVNCVERMWSTFQQQLQTDTQASFELRKLGIFSSPSLLNLPDLKVLFPRLEELNIRGMSHMEKLNIENVKKIDIASFVQSLKQLSNLRSLNLDNLEGIFFSGNLNLSKGSLETCTSSCMARLETIRFCQLGEISKLLISGEICPKLRSLTAMNMRHLQEMDFKQLDSLNTLWVDYSPKLETVTGLSSLTKLQSLTVRDCDKLETISGLSSLTGLQQFNAWSCKGLKSLPTLAHQRHLERFMIEECNELQSVEGFEELQGLKSLIIEVPHNGYAWVRNCIYGLRRLPSDNTILKGMPMDTTLSRLDVNLFSEVIDVQAVDEIKGGQYTFDMGSSSSAITIYALCTRPSESFTCMKSKSIYMENIGEAMLTVLLPHHSSEVITISDINIQKGFKVTLNEGEEDKALTLMQKIVDQLYGDSTTIES